MQKKGVVMVYTLIVLAMLLVLGTGVLTVTQSQSRSAVSTDASTTAFFVAESGAEKMLDKIYAGGANGQALSNLYTGCNGGTFSESMSTGTWTASFYKTNGDRITSCSSTSWRTDADQLKVDGTYSFTTRSVRTSIDPL